jgi:uncharacterized tellurite resistance protein B-like protein
MTQNMTPLQNLHYAIGEMAYAVARADGTVQKEERQKFHDIVNRELENENYAFDISSIIFQIMDKDKASLPDSYFWGMHQIEQNSHYLSPALKQKFITVMEKVAKAYPPVTIEERDLIERFKQDIEPLHGDPVYYDKS